MNRQETKFYFVWRLFAIQPQNSPGFYFTLSFSLRFHLILRNLKPLFELFEPNSEAMNLECIKRIRAAQFVDMPTTSIDHHYI